MAAVMIHIVLALLWLALQPPPAVVQVAVETELGRITIEVDRAHAPGTADNFLKYVEGGFYDGGRFHRTVRPDTEPRRDVPIQVVQAGINPARTAEAFPAIALERTSVTGLSHVDGVVSMARGGPDTGRSDFFICIGDQRELDFAGRRNADGQGFAAFGRVVAGMEVVLRIQAAPVREWTQTMMPPISIVRARVLDARR
jgi:peptidyl-prolyl cis-trans isomerase A (cyclophilin A)